MSIQLEEAQQNMLGISRVLRDNQIAWGSTGNISARIDDETFLISASGSWVSELQLDEMSLCHMDGSENSGPRPSVEWQMHLGIYKLRPEVNFVAHLSPHYSTLLACTDLMPNQTATVEVMVYLGRVGRVPFLFPGSQPLADAVSEMAVDHDSIILANHGIICMHATMRGLMMRVLSFEQSCRMMCSAAAAGVILNEVEDEKIQELLRIAKV